MAALPAVLAVAGAGASIYGGISAYQSGQQQGKLMRQQGDLLAQNAAANAQIQADSVRKTAARQKLEFLANGIDFSGSAVLTTQDTLDKGQKYVNSVMDQGTAQQKLAYGNATVEENKGRAALIGSFGTAAAGTFSAYKSGAFNGLGSSTAPGGTGLSSNDWWGGSN